MRRPSLPVLSLTTAALVALPATPLLALQAPDPSPAGGDAMLLARGGGGGGRGGGGRAHTGFNGGGSFTRGDKMPSGGFSSGDRLNRVGNPSISRPTSRPAGGFERPVGGGINRPDGGFQRPDNLQRPAQGLQRPGQGLQRPDGGGNLPSNIGDRTFNGGDRTFNRDGDRNLNLNRANGSINLNRDWNREVNLNNINLNPGWARPGWGVARPWNWGWYGGWSTPPWGWWGVNAAAWGIGTLASAAIINNAVNNAIATDVTYIVVPDTSYQLQFGTLQPYGNYSVSFVATANGTSYQLTADCNAGAINGRQPTSAEEAQLLNAVCQVAYGNAS